MASAWDKKRKIPDLKNWQRQATKWLRFNAKFDHEE
jgi:hypothetical protein